MQLGEALLADGRWRLMAFAGLGDDASASSPVGKLCRFLSESPESPLKRYTPAGADVDAVFDVRAVFQQSHHQLAITAMPELLFPHKGRHGLRDYEKAFCALEADAQNIYAMRGIDRKEGCLIVVRPDQYVAQVLPLGDTAALSAFFAGFMLNAN
jgi:phenol 2-monooxygenase (NADPH)